MSADARQLLATNRIEEFERDRPQLCYCLNVNSPPGALHGFAIKFVGRPANETDLVVMALGPSMGPRKLMAAKHFQEAG